MKKILIIIIAVLSLSSCATFQPITKTTIKEFNDESLVGTYYKLSNSVVFENKYTKNGRKGKVYVTKNTRVSGYGKVIEEKDNTLIVSFKKRKREITLEFQTNRVGEFVIINEQVVSEKKHKVILGDGAVLMYKPRFSRSFEIISGKK